MTKYGRNMPCHCGSGKKYKRCCIDRDKNPILKSNDPVAIMRYTIKESKIEQCLHPDQDGCDGDIINAHSIANSRVLKRISENGKVYLPISRLNNRNFEIVQTQGRNIASTFKGFCSKHDNDLFELIDNNDFEENINQIFLYTYRVFSYEYFNKLEMKENNIKLRQLDKKRSVATQELFDEKEKYSGLGDLEVDKAIFDKAILDNELGVIDYIYWKFDFEVALSGSGYYVPTLDLCNKELNNLADLTKPVKPQYYLIFPEDGVTHFLMSWTNDSDKYSEFKIQLNNLGIDDRKIFINNMVPKVMENLAINISFYDSLSNDAKKDFEFNMYNIRELLDGMESVITGSEIFEEEFDESNIEENQTNTSYYLNETEFNIFQE